MTRRRTRALETAVRDLYAWVCTLDPDPVPVASYLTDPDAQRVASELCPDIERSVA